MKKRLFVFLLTLCMCLACVPSCTAEGDAEADEDMPLERTVNIRELLTVPKKNLIVRYQDFVYEKIIEDISEEFDIPKNNLIAGYMNLATGEEHYWQGDRWELCASMYKVPLNMYAAEKLRNGEIDWENKYPDIPYKYVMEETLLHSSNRWARFLWEVFGSYADYKKGVMPYMGMEQSDYYDRYWIDNKFTARQFIACLKTLYENPDRFPSVLDTMKEAEPERFFRYGEKRYTIAQKYGFVVENNSRFVNACGIVFTEEPIAIVMFTRDALHSDATLSAYCTAMCDYTQNRMK